MSAAEGKVGRGASVLFARDFLLLFVPAVALLAVVGVSRSPAMGLVGNTVEQVGRTLLSLFLVALIFERAMEVIITTWRGPGATELETRLTAAQDAIEFFAKDQALPIDQRATRERQLVDEKAAVTAALVTYRCETKRLALHLAFLFGLGVAAVGLRTVEPALVVPPDAHAWQLPALKVLDALLTGGVIAGGSEGIHKIMQMFTDFAEATSKRSKAG